MAPSRRDRRGRFRKKNSISIDVLKRSMKVKKAMVARGHRVEEYWKSIAPVFGETGLDEKRSAPPDGSPGDYRDSIRTVVTEGDDGIMRVRVDATDKKRFWIEYGTAHMPEYACKARALKRFRL